MDSYRIAARVASVIALVLAMIAGGSLAVSAPAAAAETGAYVLYGDSIENGFADWSWATVDTAHTGTPESGTVHSGSAAVSVDAGPWAAFYISRSDEQPLPLHGSLRFELHGGTSADPIGIQIISSVGDSQPISIEPSVGGWTSYSLDLADLGGFGTFTGIWFQNQTPDERPTFYVDDVRIVTGEAPPPTDGPSLLVDLGERSITRTVTDPASGQVTNQTVSFPHQISDDIYGMNFVTNGVREELAVPVNRWGGNSTERYNHEIATSNIGNDWYFMNDPGNLGGDHQFENDNQADGTDTIMTLPMAGWVAKNREANCGYPTVDLLGPANNAGPQDSEAPHWLNQALLCGNGFVGGERIYGVDPGVTSKPVDENFAADWVSHLVATHGNAASGGVETYALGNEPGLWNSTHADIRPEPVGRTELIDRNQTWANAVKQADPTAAVIGPVLWSGFSYYVTSEEFANNQRPGDVPTFVEDYLKEMKQASDSTGVRLLDQLAVNFYDDRVYGGGSDALRLEATRQLWDPSYAPADWWVSRDFLYGDGSAVIPRLNSLIDQNFPGTGLAITEYNFGGVDSLAGGLAQADVLGIFGREGLDMANVWEPYGDWIGLTEEEYAARPIFDAFRLYRNYDGRGSRFGDVSNFAQSSDEAAVAVHAATRSADGALTVLLINKSTADYNSPLTIAGASGTAERYDYSAATNGVIARGSDVALTGDTTAVALPARSASLLVIPSSDGPPPPPPPPAVVYPTLGPGMQLIDAPTSTAEGGPLDSAESIFVWLEQGPVELATNLKVNRVADGNFRGSSNTQASIPAGTTVCSWFVHADHLRDRGRLLASLSFSGSDVLGVIGRRADLRNSDAIGATGTTYVHNGSERNDYLTLRRTGDTATTTFNFATRRATDSIRIITDCQSD